MVDLVGVPEIAEMLGVTRRSVFRYIDRPDFPEPAAQVAGKRLWQRGQIKRWAARTLPLDHDPRPPDGG